MSGEPSTITRAECKALAAAMRVSEARRQAEGLPFFGVASDEQIDRVYDEIEALRAENLAAIKLAEFKRLLPMNETTEIPRPQGATELGE